MADVRVLGAVLPLVFVGEPGSRHLLWIDPSLGETVYVTIKCLGPVLLWFMKRYIM
jgi:hypothetical protein